MPVPPLLRACAIVVGFCFIHPPPASSQQIRPEHPTSGQQENITGKWSYRSFVAEPDLSVGPRVFGQGTLEFSAPQGERLAGTLGGEGWQLNLTGTFSADSQQVLRFQGRGIIGGEEWVYDYLGFVVPAWSNGINQRPAIVGSIVRTAPHSNGQGGTSPAGVVAQWIAVRQDQPEPQPNLQQQETKLNRRQLFELYKQEELGRDQRPANEVPVRKPSSAQPSPDALRNNRLAIAPAIETPKSAAAPVEVRAQNGQLHVELTVGYNDLQAPDPLKIGNHPVHLRTYNGRLAGPTLRAKAGDTLFITLRNDLPPEPAGGGHETNGHHEWNTTNLHFHGLHVAPQGAPDAESDNVLLSLPPGKEQKYVVKIPEDHVAGTFWYHAHRHGSTAAQVSSGLAGALIIEREDQQHNVDSVPEVAAARQEVMLLQQIPYLKPNASQPGSIERPNEVAMFAPGRWRDLRRYITVNGEKIPTIQMAPGEIRRFRLIASGQRERMLIGVERAAMEGAPSPERLKLHEIAVDGLPTGNIRATEELELWPGYRSDVLVQIPSGATGEYYLVDRNAATGTGDDGSPEPLRWIARLRITGPEVAMSLPAAEKLLPHRLKMLTDSDGLNTRYAFYGITQNGFFISRENVPVNGVPAGSEFNPNDVRELILGDRERWEVGSRNQGLNVTHPFHIHVNPFLVTKVLNASNQDVTVAEFGGPVWRDTLAMKQGFTYTLLTEYKRFTGEFVSHCHILDHEDTGMMEKIRIKERGAGALNQPPQKPAAGVAAPANKIVSTIPIPDGKASVLLFVKGPFCTHCLAQLSEAAAKIPAASADVFVISESTEEEIREFPPLPFQFVPDPQHRLAKQYGAYDQAPKHATIVRNALGRELLREVGDEPFLDLAAVQNALNSGNAAPTASNSKNQNL